jgi:hypothetical protein
MFNIPISNEPKIEPRIPLIFDTDRSDQDRLPLINGFSRKLLNRKYFLERESQFELYTGLFGTRFLRIFEPTTTVDDRKSYYPIFITLIDIVEIFQKIQIPEMVLEEIYNGNCKILLACPYEGWQWSYWEKLVTTVVRKYGLKVTDMVVLCGNYAEPDRLSTISFNPWEYFREHDNTGTKDADYLQQLISSKVRRKYKFICLNRRPTPERYAITSLLFPYQDIGILTCAKVGGYDLNYSNFQYNEFHSKFPDQFDFFNENVNGILPLKFAGESIDAEIENPADDFSSSKFLDSYLYIVTETFYDDIIDRMFFSEKIFKPLVFMMPFILLGQPYSLKKLRDLGYKTFHPFVDESYDLEIDGQKRMNMAFEQIKKIISLSFDELNDLMCQLLPILLHNKNNLHLRCSTIILSTLHKDLLDKLNADY